MQMARHTRATRNTLVDADVQALRLKRSLTQSNGTIDELPQLSALLRFVIRQRRARIAQRDQQVPVGVGVLVEQDHPVLGADDDVVGFVVLGREPVVEQEAAG